MRKGIPTLVLQNEISECGLACISMFAEHYGVEAPLEKLRDKFPASVHGSTLASLCSTLSEIGIPVSPVVFEFEDLSALPLPAILHYGAGHYVLLAWRSGKQVCVLNPALGMQLLTFDALKKEISGYALIHDEDNAVSTSNKWPQRTDKKILPAWLSIKSTAKIPFIHLLMVTSLLISMAVFIIPAVMSSSLNALFNHQNLDDIVWWYYIVAFIAVAGMDLVNSVFSANLVRHFSHTSNAHGFMRLIHQPLRYFQKRNGGEIYSRFSHWCVAQGQKIRLDNTLRSDWLIAALAFGVMFWISPLLTLISCISVIFMGVISLWAAWQDRSYTQRMEAQGAELNEFIMETVNGIHTIKSAGLQAQRQIEFAARNQQLLEVMRRYAIYSKIKSNLYQLVNNGETILFIAISLPLLQANTMSFGMFVSYGLIKQIYGNYMSKLFFTVLEKNELGVIDKRADDFLISGTLPESNAQRTVQFSQSVTFTDLTFGWTPEDNILNKLNLTLGKGECLAIVGESGEGKTTLLSIIAGLLNTDSGQVSIDGAEQMPGQWTNMAFMSSTNHILLQGDVRDNITLFKSLHTAREDQQIMDILSALGLANVIEKLPGGLNARIREGNSALSAGQHQRLLLARALFCSHELIVLDEPTANLDEATAKQTMSAVINHCRQKNKTLIVVTHNSALLNEFDTVYQLVHGQLQRHSQAENHDDCR